MKILVVTGGIASGKSTAVEILRQWGGEGLEVFDCDREAAELLRSGRVSRDLVTAFGADALDANGNPDRDFLRRIVQEESDGREKLNGITHPKLAQLCLEKQQAARERGDVHTFVVDIPLFFESKAEFGADIVCVVACSPEQQIERLMSRNPERSREEALAMLAAQMQTSEKVDRADVVFWNSGDKKLLEAQLRLFHHAHLESEAAAFRAGSVVINANELREKDLNELQSMAAALPRQGLMNLPRAELLCELMRGYLQQGSKVQVSGVLEMIEHENFAVLRDPKRSFRNGADDIYVGADLLKRYGLRPGNAVTVRLRRPARGRQERYLAAAELLEIEGMPAEDFEQSKDFERLTALIPNERLILEGPNLDKKETAEPTEKKEKNSYADLRVLDLVCPLGKGQRALIVAPPRGGKTVLLKHIARSLRTNYPEADLLVLLLDERPEEVTDFEENIDAPVYASTFDEPSRRHAQLSELVLERARRLVEQGRDVIILLDSLTRLARGYNAKQSGGRTMSGGLGSNALEKPRKFFGAARKLEEGGSLTIVATCLVDTESRMDEIIFEEFKGTGNMEIRLDRELSERRIYPAISLSQSGTRNDDRLYHPDEFTRILQLRRQLACLPAWEGLEALLKNIAKTQNNAELLLRGLVIR